MFSAFGGRWRVLAALIGLFRWIALQPSVVGPLIILLTVAVFFKERQLARKNLGGGHIDFRKSAQLESGSQRSASTPQ